LAFSFSSGDSDRRPPRLKEAVMVAEQLIGAERAEALVNANPWKIALDHFDR
jgi:hypothetical protein